MSCEVNEVAAERDASAPGCRVGVGYIGGSRVGVGYIRGVGLALGGCSGVGLA